MADLKDAFIEWWSTIKMDVAVIKKYFISLSIVYIIGILSIIRANYNYMDDFGRVLYGYRGFDIFSRYLAHYLSIFVHADGILNDISPLPQIMAVFILGLAGSILIRTFRDNQDFSWISIAALVPLGLTPYFLECFSFKFDAPYMALSILASVLPLMFIGTNLKLFMGITFICTLVMCMTYQAASGIFVICILFLFSKKWNDGSDIKLCLYGIGKSLSSFIVAMIVYRFVILKPFNDYVSTDVFGDTSLYIVIINNVNTLFSYFKEDMTDIWIIIVSTLCICFIRSFVLHSSREKWKAFLLALLLLPVGCILSYGAFLILQKPLFYPRSMYGIGVFLSIIGLLALNNKSVNHLTKIVVVAMAWSMITFSLAYGNCLAEQRRYENFRVQLVLNDLSKIPDMGSKHIRKMQLQGSIGYSPAVYRVSKRYKVLERLIHTNISADFCFGEFYLFKYFNLPGVTQVPTWGDEQRTLYEKGLPIFVDTAYHRIKADDRSIIVLLKKPSFEDDKKEEEK